MLNSCRPTVVWLFAILHESLNVWLYCATFACGVIAISCRRPSPSSSAVLVVCRRHPLSSATSNNLGHRPVDHSAGPSAHLMHRRRYPELTSEAQKTSITSPSATLRSFPVLARAIPRQTGVPVTIVHACITALHGLQINCATLKWLPSAGYTQT